jgi:hypothetical protein
MQFRWIFGEDFLSRSCSNYLHFPSIFLGEVAHTEIVVHRFIISLSRLSMIKQF